ncbi:glycosyltransferase family 39 protein [Alloacidobacterium sp.]|uniref:glycosyltransferase family 39 protein n=1 Tax=Alloacidobacterium sp. TaxID=2951999 RepID=UPI002D3495C7|nr:glycosyltransferase family 39 protein [Alloacidobacterium sp.]HYK34898.1 glycosyltransferase family 39 protein [Alloacidobacterium sp.]
MTATQSQAPVRAGAGVQSGTVAVLAIAAAIAFIHILTNSRYGFHRDELQFLSDARHLDWGSVAYPPFTPFIERVSMGLFGLSLVGLRLFSVITQAAVIVVTGLVTRELGGGRLAQIVAAFSIALAPLPLFEGTEFQYSSFDYLWWALIAYFIIRVLKTENPRWWIAVGITTGIALQTKYSVCFYIAGILGGMLLTQARRYFLNKWFWMGTALAVLIFLPNLLWQVQHGFISYHFLQHIHKRDVGEGRAHGFLLDQFLICTNLFTAPLWIAGLIGFLRSPRYRLLAWMYVIPLALFFFGKGRGYYLAAAYPMLMAMGAVVSERWTVSLRKPWRRTVEGIYFASTALVGLYLCALILPIASSGPLKKFILSRNGDMREEIGWNELVATVAGIRDSLPPDQQASYGVLVGNYGEQGAIEILGAAYHLPVPISTTNSAWLRGYPTPPPTTLIVIGYSREEAENAFTDCRLAEHNGNSLGVKNEESNDHPDIFVCGPPRLPWPKFWSEYQNFG